MTKRKDAPITDEALQGICNEFLRSSLGGPDTEVSAARVRNLIAYNALPEGDFAPPEVADRSDFVATDVADTIEGMLPQLMRIFVSSENAVEFQPKKPGQTELAKTITGYVNHLFYVRNDGLNVMYDWFKDALIQKVGFVKVWAEEESEDSKATYTGLTEEQVAMLMQDGAEIVGEPMLDEAGITVAVKHEETKIAIKVAAVSPHEMRIDPNARWGREPSAIGQVFLRPKFELDEEGYDTENLSESTYRGYAEALQELGETPDWTAREIHESHRMVEFAELYLELDRDGDGVAEWVKVVMLGNEIATKNGKPDIEQVDDHPFADVCPIPRPHAYFGDCPADRLYDTQKHRTNLIRALLDNVYQSVNQRTYVNKNAGVNIDDLLDSRPLGIVRGDLPMSEAISPIVQPSLGAPAYQLNELFEHNAENRSGFNRYSAGTDAQSLNKTARGVELLTAKADMRTELIARFMAQGVVKMFAKMLKLSIQHQDKEDWMEVNGQFVPVNPSEWDNQYNVRINVGLGHGTNDQKLARVMAMVPLQQMGLQVGAVGPEHIAKTIRAAASASEFQDVDDFAYEQPQGPPMQQLQQQMQQMQQQLQQMGEKGQQLEQENAQLKLANQNKQGELEIKAAEVQSKHAIALKPDDKEPDDKSIEWAKLEVARFEAETKRMALGYNADEAARQFELDRAKAQHDALMAEAAHEQREAQTGRPEAE